jgi:pimeloyl-ACP methyl ester carboxylesterase
MAQLWLGFAIVLFAIVLVGIATIVVQYFRDIRAARARINNQVSQVIETDIGPIEYARVGDGYPVLVVHGAMGGFDQGLWLAHGFDISKCQVISISRFGYLRSPLPANANLDLQADAFACLLDALEIRQVAVFSVSAGSTSAIRFAARYPDRISALILLCPDSPGKIQMPMPPRFVFDTLLRSDFIYWTVVKFFGKSVQTAIGLVPRGYVLTPEHAAMISKVQAGDLPVSQRIDGMIFESYTSLPEFMASVTSASLYPLGGIQAPVLVIHALDDPIALSENVRALAEQMPNARLFAVPDGGHFLLGHTEEVKAEIAQFLHSNVAELKNGR